MNFFKRILNLFRKKQEVVSQPSVAPVINTPSPEEVNRLEWKAYEDLNKATGVLPTTTAAPRETTIPPEMLGKTYTYEEYLIKKYGKVPDFGRDLTPEEILATATHKDLSALPEPPAFHFMGDSPEEQKFNELRAKSQQEAYRYLLTHEWNTLGTKFREQALEAGIDKESIGRIINTYSNAGGGVYYKP
jgi:hypothetical protein